MPRGHVHVDFDELSKCLQAIWHLRNMFLLLFEYAMKISSLIKQTMSVLKRLKTTSLSLYNLRNFRSRFALVDSTARELIIDEGVMRTSPP